MDNNLQESLRLLKLGYIEKLKGMIPEFRLLVDNINDESINELYKKVHTISGTSGMYGLNELSDFSTNFEVYLKKIQSADQNYDENVLKALLVEYIEKIENIIKGENDG